MALQPQIITLDFGYGGLDQKTDVKRVIPTRLTELQDARFNKIGRLDRRAGNAVFGTQSVTVSRLLQLATGIASVSESNTTSLPFLTRYTTGGIASTNVTNVATGAAVLQTLPVDQLIATNIGPSQPIYGSSIATGNAQFGEFAVAYSNNYICLVYSRDVSLAGNGLRVDFVDRTTKAVLKTELWAGQYLPAVVAHPDGRDQFVIAAHDMATPTNVRFATISATTSLTGVITGLPVEGTVTNTLWDITSRTDATQANGAMIYVAYGKGVAGVKLQRATWPSVTGAGAALSSTTIATISGGAVKKVALANIQANGGGGGNADIRVLWVEPDAGNDKLRSSTYNNSLTVQLAPAVLTFVNGGVDHLAAVQLADGTAQVAVDIWAGFPAAPALSGYTVNASNTATFLWTTNNLHLASKMQAPPLSSVAYFYVVHNTAALSSFNDTQANTLFLFGATAYTTRNLFSLGRMFHGTAFGTTSAHVPDIQFQGYGANAAPRCYGAWPSLTKVAGTNDKAQYALNEISFAISDPFAQGRIAARARNEVLVTGGNLTIIDGFSAAPAAPQLFPVAVSLSATTSGGSMALGSYSVSGYYKYTDTSGRIRRSATMLPSTFSLTGTQNALVLTARNYPIPDDFMIGSVALNGATLAFVPTRTLLNESQVYYRAAADVPMNASSSVFVVNLNAADATVAASEPMYTAGGVADDWQPSCPVAIAGNGKRFLVVSGDDPNFVMESKPSHPQYGTAFMQGTGKRVEADGTRCYGIASYLDKWLLFKGSTVFAAQGDGADVTRQNDTLGDFQPISTGLGCRQARSIVTTSVGVIFNSDKGFYLIAGDLNPVYIGAAVEDYTAAVIDSAYDEINDIVYFLLTDGNVLVLTIFATEVGVDVRWSTDLLGFTPGQKQVGSLACYNGLRFTALNVTGSAASTIFVETPGLYFENSRPSDPWSAFQFTSAWIPAAQIQGFGRLWSLLVLGDMPRAPGTFSFSLNITVFYDYDDLTYETLAIDPSQAPAPVVGNAFQCEVRPLRQRFEAVRVQITQNTASMSNSAFPGVRINQVALKVGIKSGANKLPAAARALSD